MQSERKSKRQERRAKMVRQERLNRLTVVGLMVVGAAFLVFAVVWPQLNTDIVAIDPGTHPNANDNSLGDTNAPILVEEFSDFQCPFCERFHEETEPLLRQYYVETGKVRFVYRSMGNFVSDNIARATGAVPKTESQDAALAMYCAGDQNKFWDMHASLYANVLGEDAGSFTEQRIKAISKTAGLDTRQFNDCYDSGKYADRVQQDYADGTAANINATPSFLITYTVAGETKTRMIEGAQPFTAFQAELEAALNEIGTD